MVKSRTSAKPRSEPDSLFANGKSHPHLGIYDEYCGPHCDVRVLHAPGECDSCDKFPVYQKARELWGVCFTTDDGLAPPGFSWVVPDPYRVARPAGSNWPGNQTSQHQDPYAALLALTHEFTMGEAVDPDEIERAIDSLQELKRELTK